MKKSDKKKGIKGAWPATVICFLVAAIVIMLGYAVLAIFRGYKLLDFVDSVVGNLIGVFGGFCIFDILYNKLTQEEQTRETSQQITKTLMGEPEILDAFEDEDKRNFLKSTISSMVKDEDAVDMLVTNMEKYFDKMRGARIRKSFDYIINLDSSLPQEYADAGFPGIKEGKYYLIEEELKFTIKYLSQTDINYIGSYVSIGFAYDKKSLDAGLLETGRDDDFAKCIFNEDLVIEPEAVDYINKIPADQLYHVIDSLFVPVLRIDNSEGDEDEREYEVERKSNGIILKFKLDYDKSLDITEHTVNIYFKMPRVWDSIFEVTLVDPTKEPHIKLKYKSGMDVSMYSYLNKEAQSNSGACIKRAGLYDIAIKDEWIYPKSGVVFQIKKKN
ncbi:MAG: hypothetical protein ACI4DU_08535 [Lachnospiraceae bacterium]